MHNNALAQDAKRRRQDALLEIIQEGALATQEELVAALKKGGVKTTQASLSRDIAELGIVKLNGSYAVQTTPAAPDPEMPLRAFVLSIRTAGQNLLVLKTRTGTAPQVGLALDARPERGIVGTIAGDDTVFAAMESPAAAKRLLRHIESIQAGARES